MTKPQKIPAHWVFWPKMPLSFFGGWVFFALSFLKMFNKQAWFRVFWRIPFISRNYPKSSRYFTKNSRNFVKNSRNFSKNSSFRQLWVGDCCRKTSKKRAWIHHSNIIRKNSQNYLAKLPLWRFGGRKSRAKRRISISLWYFPSGFLKFFR